MFAEFVLSKLVAAAGAFYFFFVELQKEWKQNWNGEESVMQ